MSFLHWAGYVLFLGGVLYLSEKMTSERRAEKERYENAYRELALSSDRRAESINTEFRNMHDATLETAMSLWVDGEISDKALQKIKDALKTR